MTCAWASFLLLPNTLETQLPDIVVVDPASRRQVQLPPPPPFPHNAPPAGVCWDSCFIGAAVLARAHASRLTFDVVCLTVDGGRPRVCVASVLDGNFASWRALPRAQGVVIDSALDPFDQRCVHAAGNIYWHVSNSSHVLQLDPRTLDFSFVTVPDAVGHGLFGVIPYRIGETPEDGRLCIALLAEDESLQIWVRGGESRWSDRGWSLQREIVLSRLFDAVPGLPKDNVLRMRYISLSDMDYARTGKVFISTEGYGRYSFHLKTRNLEPLVMEDGKEYGHPIYAYTLLWLPEFAAPKN